MAFLANHAETDLMRAVTHARMHVTSGRGLESVIHDLAHSHLGSVSASLHHVIKEMNGGLDAEEALATVADRVEDENLRAFLQALRAPGGSAVNRLNDLTTQIHQNWNFAVEKYGSRVGGLVQGAAVLFVLSFIPTILKVIFLVPEKLEMDISLPSSLDAVLFTSLSLIITAILLLMRVR